MRVIAFIMLVSGWLIALSALVLLPALPARFVFVLAGLAVEAIGIGLLTHAYKSGQRPAK